jgi:hypothetical protein
MAQFKELLVFGTTKVLDTVYAKRFVGKFEGEIKGNAETATKASQDALGQNIASTYVSGITTDGTTITITKGDGTTSTVSTQDTHVELVDDLTTDDATKALTASQGVELKSQIDNLKSASTWEILA